MYLVFYIFFKEIFYLKIIYEDMGKLFYIFLNFCINFELLRELNMILIMLYRGYLLF